jgi:hypothetical protein
VDRRTLSLLFVFSSFILSDAQLSLAQSISIFGNAVPKNPIDDALAVTIGVKFWSSTSGTVSGIRFYRAAANPQGYIAKLFSADGTLLGSATLARESGPLPGWQEADFASPIPISPNTTYVAAYYCPIGQGAWDAFGLQNGVTNGPLTAPSGGSVGGNGVYNYGNVFPSSSYEQSNYYVDVAFIPAAAAPPYLILSFDPANPSISASTPLGSTVSAIKASWSDGSPFAGSLNFGPPYSNAQGVFAISGNNLIVNPAGPGMSGSANTTLNVTVVATQGATGPTAPPPPGPGPVSLDGTILTAPSSGSLTTAAGTWTFGTTQSQPGQYQIFLNGNYASGWAAAIEVNNGGKLYAYDSYLGNWYVWNNGWSGSAAPPPPTGPGAGPVSPDGTILTAPSSGSLKTAAGTWTFGTTQPLPGQYEIFLNGYDASGWAAAIEVKNGGKLYAYNSYLINWYIWNNGWSASTAP